MDITDTGFVTFAVTYIELTLIYFTHMNTAQRRKVFFISPAVVLGLGLWTALSLAQEFGPLDPLGEIAVDVEEIVPPAAPDDQGAADLNPLSPAINAPSPRSPSSRTLDVLDLKNMDILYVLKLISQK